MEMKNKEKFQRLWNRYFDDSELPIVSYYTDEGVADPMGPPSEHCLIALLRKAFNGETLRLSSKSIGCPGGCRYTGFTQTMSSDFEYFLSCGIPGKFEGERYKKSPELVREAMNNWPTFKAPARHVVFKRWDLLDESDEPEVVIFFSESDVVAGLFTLASFDEADANMVIAPFGSGCSTIVMYPYLEAESDHPRCVIGMFDLSARPHVRAETFSFAAPMKKFIRMVDNMEESFLTTPTWDAMLKRIKKDKTKE
jgi:hypothetical protein